MKKKYELTDETKRLENGRVLHRIKALMDFGDVKNGELGGWVEKEFNLSQDGGCWVGGNAYVYGDARVCDNAQVCDNARVYSHAKVYDNALVCDNAWVSDNARVYDEACVYSHAQVYGGARVYSHAQVYGNALVYGDAVIYGYAQVYGDAVICGDAVVGEMGDYTIFQNTWSSGRWFTYTKSNDKWKVGCFYGTGDELIAKAYADGKQKGRCYEKIVNLVNSLCEEQQALTAK